MRWLGGLVLAALLFALAADAIAGFGLGMGTGIDDLHKPTTSFGGGGGGGGCTQGRLRFNGGCNSVYFVMGY